MNGENKGIKIKSGVYDKSSSNCCVNIFIDILK
jgi:hypothetical protein